MRIFYKMAAVIFTELGILYRNHVHTPHYNFQTIYFVALFRPTPKNCNIIRYGYNQITG